MWREVLTATDALALLSVFGGFHDAILKEARFDSGSLVDNDLDAVFLGKEKCHLRCVFQRQVREVCVIELIFSGLQYCILPYNESSTVFQIKMEKSGDLWCLTEKGCQSEIDVRYLDIRSSRVFWRIRNEWLGVKERYTAVSQSDLDYYDPLELM